MTDTLPKTTIPQKVIAQLFEANNLGQSVDASNFTLNLEARQVIERLRLVQIREAAMCYSPNCTPEQLQRQLEIYHTRIQVYTDLLQARDTNLQPRGN